MVSLIYRLSALVSTDDSHYVFELFVLQLEGLVVLLSLSYYRLETVCDELGFVLISLN
jgi:hypothetical protein